MDGREKIIKKAKAAACAGMSLPKYLAMDFLKTYQ
jgi:hypothetical protein